MPLFLELKSDGAATKAYLEQSNENMQPEVRHRDER